METIRFMYIWLNYSDKKNYLEGITVAVKNIDHFLGMSSELL